MTPLEVNAAGRPVVAFRGGGARETIVEGLKGVFFEEPTAQSLAGAMPRLEGMDWDAAAIREHAAGLGWRCFGGGFESLWRRLGRDGDGMGVQVTWNACRMGCPSCASI